ncbi:MAG: ATP-binding protein [Eubacterium sp.]|nr:ATP-binding protein [Eubacterium sp.]
MEILRKRYLNKLISKKDNGQVKVITGLRRSGKTYLLKNIYMKWLEQNGIPRDHILFLALDQNKNSKYRNPILLDQFLREEIRKRSGRCYVIIDEIQYAVPVPNPDIPAAVQTKSNAITFYDTILGLMDSCDLYVTGSNSEMLSSDILTNFRGRGDEVRVYPLSYSEYCAAYKGDKADAWRDYLFYGGMPLVLSKEDRGEKGAYLQDLFEKTYSDDILERNHIKSKDDLGRVVDCLASTLGSFVNPTNISDILGNENETAIARNTVADYIEHCKKAFLIEEAKRFDIRGKEYITGQQKYYFTDVGLRNARLNFRQFDVPHLIENVVYNELRIRGLSVDVGRVQIRSKNKKGDYQTTSLESDFVVNDLDRRFYIQVTEGIDDPGKKEQEMRSLLHIKDSFPKIVLVNQDIPMYRSEEGIIFLSIKEFLLDETLMS